MYITSAVFNQRIRESGKRKTVVDIVTSAGVILASDIPVDSGSVTVDRNAAVRRFGNVVIPDRALVPSFTSGNLLPYGTEIRIRQGIVYGDGSEDLIPIGTFILDTTSWEEDRGPIPKIEFFDRAMVMQRADVGHALDSSGYLPSEVIVHLMQYFWPELNVQFDSNLSDERNPGGTTWTSGNHWTIVQQMARKMGAEIFFNVIGDPVVRRLPVFNRETSVSDAVWDVTVGDNGILISADRAITRKDVYNSVYITGASQPGGIIPFGHALNTDPNSPTNRDGPFRKMGKKLSDNTLVTAEQCQQMAEQKLAEITRLSQTLSFEAVPNPAVDAGDIVKLVYSSGETQLGLVETLKIPIGKGTMSGKCSVARV